MRFSTKTVIRRSIVPTALAAALLAWGPNFVMSETLVPRRAPAVVPATASAAAETSPQTRIVIVEWKIKKGHEQEFLDYWAQKSTIPDRSGLIAEFMSGEESRDRFPWINWTAAESNDTTIFYNVGIWRQADDFMGQIGKYIDNNRPPMAFEADHRHRVFLAPLKWRVGLAALPGKDADGVK